MSLADTAYQGRAKIEMWDIGHTAFKKLNLRRSVLTTYSKFIEAKTIRIIAKVARPTKKLWSFGQNGEEEEILMVLVDSKRI